MPDLSPLGRMLGNPGDAVTCKVIVPGEIEVHWFAEPAPLPGTSCMCGRRTKKDDDDA